MIKIRSELALRALVFLAVVFVSGFAVATAHEPNATKVAITIPENTDQNSTLAERLAAREISYRQQLQTISRQRIVAKCMTAQDRLTSLKNKESAAIDKRRQVYNNLATSLDNMVKTLKPQNIDVSELVTADAQFNSALNTYFSDAETYRLAIEDLLSVDCTSQPMGFGASLLEARQVRSQLAKDTENVKEALKKVFQSFGPTKTRLAPTSQASGSQN